MSRQTLWFWKWRVDSVFMQLPPLSHDISLPQLLLVLETDSGHLPRQATDHAPQVDLGLPWSHGSSSYSFNGDNIMRDCWSMCEKKVDMCYHYVSICEELFSILIFLSHCLCIFWVLRSSAQLLWASPDCLLALVCSPSAMATKSPGTNELLQGFLIHSRKLPRRMSAVSTTGASTPINTTPRKR